MEQALPDDQIARLGEYDLEMENGILNLIVSLVKQKEARGIPTDVAKEEAAIYLDRLANGLRSMNK